MIKYHPDTRFITDYAAGSLPTSQSLCVAAHLHYCSECRRKVHALTDIGAEMFNELKPQNLAEGSFELFKMNINTPIVGSVTRKITQEVKSVEKTHTLTISKDNIEHRQTRDVSNLPRSIVNYTKGNLNGLKWSSIGKSFRFSHLNTKDSTRETTLFHIKAGCKVPKHKHRGDEITIVLRGSFSDKDDHYQPGDFIVRTKGESHSPVAAQNGDCLCLSTLDEPIVMHNWIFRLLSPLLRRRAHLS